MSKPTKATLNVVTQIASVLEDTGHQAIIDELERNEPIVNGIHIDVFSTANQKVVEMLVLLCSELHTTPRITRTSQGNDVRITIGAPQ